MQRAFHSPLPALNHENRVGEPLPLWHAIGVVSHLMLEHPDYRGLNVATVFNLIFQQLKRCQGEIFLDEQQRPIGYASWLIVDKQVHDQLMSESINADSLLESAVNLRQDAYLWFLDLITPFSTSLPILRQLREQLNEFQNAWLVRRSINKTSFDYERDLVTQSLPRKLW